MFDHWSDEVNLKKAYVGVTNVLESNPNAYIWAGRDFHQRPQQGINDYFWMNHDGQGAGVKKRRITLFTPLSLVWLSTRPPCQASRRASLSTAFESKP